VRTTPTFELKPPKLSTEVAFVDRGRDRPIEAKHAIGSRALLAFAFALYTSQRSAGFIRMGRQHIREGRIEVVQQKTKARLSVPMHPDLLANIAATPSDHLTFIVSEHGKPFASARGFGQHMRTWAREAGLTRCSLPGLQKACCAGSLKPDA